MFIHFAFGELARQGKLEEQTDGVIELILKNKRLKASKCKEFIPAFPEKGAKRIPPKMFEVTDDGVASATFYPKEDPAWFSKLPDATAIHYLPIDVSMICFIKMSFNQLRTSTHEKEYGRFGLVLTDKFLKDKDIKPVLYYTEDGLWSDEIIKKWNYDQKSLSKKDKMDLEREIVSYRKPATLFPSFKESVIIKLTRESEGTKLEYRTYDRYPDGYDFKKENEHRIVFDKDEEYLYFDESDLYMIITPNLESKTEIEAFLYQTWTQRPQIKIFPS